MADTKKRSREENIREMERLKEMYRRLPPEKQKAARAHMQSRMDELQAAINGSGGRGKSKGMGMTQTILLVLLAAVVALGAGFFGVSFLAQ